MGFLRIDYTPYTLDGVRPREGSLLRFETPFGFGYADCHPWPELGDLPLKDQLQALKKRRLTPITMRSFAIACEDAKARAHKISLFKGLNIPKSHYFLHDHSLSVPEGYHAVKVKNPTISLLKTLPEKMKWRIDFNESLTLKQFQAFLKEAPLEKIEWIEDPIPYDPNLWKSFNLPLACDAQVEKATTCALFVVKPARINPSVIFERKMPVLVTSYLDHPIGQLSAAFYAAKFQAQHAGLVTHCAYLPNDFSSLLQVKNGVLIPPEGTGLGFDDLLEALPWRQLCK